MITSLLNVFIFTSTRRSYFVHHFTLDRALVALGRDWRLLNGPFFSDGPLFLDTLGVYKNFTVEKGIPKGSKAEVNRFVLYKVAEQLLIAIQRDMDLLQYDYSFRFTGYSRKGSGSISGFRVNGYYACVDTRPRRFCLLELREALPDARSRLVGQIDIRNKSEIETDDWGILKVKKRKARVTWQDVLPQMIEFLKQRKSKTVVINHKLHFPRK